MIITILFIVWMVSTVIWLHEMNRFDVDVVKTSQMKQIFTTPQGFVFIFLTSPILLIIMWISDAIYRQTHRSKDKNVAEHE